MNFNHYYLLVKYTVLHPFLALRYFKYHRYTMFYIVSYVKNLQLAKKFEHIEGAVVECGTWRGGMIAGFADLLGNNKRYYLFDSFEGLPDVTEKDGKEALEYQNKTKLDPKFGFNNCTAEIGIAEEAMKKSNCNDYHLIKGWFDVTTPQYDKSQPISILHLDGDWYNSIAICLENLYDAVTPGGVIILDDYTEWEGCTRAVNDFLSKRDLPIAIRQFNNNISYFVKPVLK